MSRLYEPMVLEDRFVRLEPFEERHREPLREAADDPDLWQFHITNLNNKTFDCYFDLYLDATAEGRECAHVVIDQQTGKIAGSSVYLAIVPAHRRLEIGSTWYAKAFQGGQTNPATKRLLIGHVLDDLRWNRVEFKLDARNKRSWSAMRKLGAVEEGIHRAHSVLPDGYVRDSVWFSVTQADWPRVRAGLNIRLGEMG